ncbi:MAG: LOG family protein [Firmicutes bacterium]|nr:LOG family protein [Bacillota bacterium]
MKNKPSKQCLKSADARAVRIFEEFVGAKEKFQEHEIKNTIVMFGSARIKPDDSNLEARKYYESAVELAHKLALWTKEKFKNAPQEDKYYIATGGGGGIMEAANKGASLAGEKTIGLNILLPFEQEANEFIPKDLVFNFHYFFVRKFYFVYHAKAFAIFPGGFGTLDELFEIITLAQCRKMQKTIPFVIFGKEFFSKIINFDMLLNLGLISKEDSELFILTDDVDEAFNHITNGINESLCLINC